MEPTIPWYQSAIVRQQILAFLLGIFALLKVTGVIAPDAVVDLEGPVTAVLAAIAAVIPLWTIVTRLFKPTPPITETAVEKTAERAVKAVETKGA